MMLTHASTTVAELGERALVARITAALAQPSWVVVGPGDDAAVIESVPRTLEVLTTDAIVEGVHFDRRFTPPDAIGHRALAVNLSDLASMGARPRAALLSLVLPGGMDVAELDALVAGLTQLAGQEHIAIVGGNVTSSPGPLIIDITATGSVHRRRVLTRRGARVGDDVYVTGTLGDAAVGLRSLQRAVGANTVDVPVGFDQHREAAQHKYLRPTPRVRAGMLLGDHRAATACIDLSDGLGDGVRRIADASGVGITLLADAIPFGDATRAWHRGNTDEALDTVFRAGDDYELLFTCSPRSRGRLRSVQRLTGGLQMTRIGSVTRGRDLCVRTPSGERPIPGGFAHFE